jgi:hypothetical protein
VCRVGDIESGYINISEGVVKAEVGRAMGVNLGCSTCIVHVYEATLCSIADGSFLGALSQYMGFVIPSFLPRQPDRAHSNTWLTPTQIQHR